MSFCRCRLRAARLMCVCVRVSVSYSRRSSSSGRLSGPHSVIEESEVVPLGTCLSLEVPEDPSLTALLVGVDLCSDVVSCVVSHGLVPLVDEVLGSARAHKAGRGIRAVGVTSRVGTIVSSSDTVPVLV